MKINSPACIVIASMLLVTSLSRNEIEALKPEAPRTAEAQTLHRGGESQCFAWTCPRTGHIPQSYTLEGCSDALDLRISAITCASRRYSSAIASHARRDSGESDAFATASASCAFTRYSRSCIAQTPPKLTPRQGGVKLVSGNEAKGLDAF